MILTEEGRARDMERDKASADVAEYDDYLADVRTQAGSIAVQPEDWKKWRPECTASLADLRKSYDEHLAAMTTKSIATFVQPPAKEAPAEPQATEEDQYEIGWRDGWNAGKRRAEIDKLLMLNQLLIGHLIVVAIAALNVYAFSASSNSPLLDGINTLHFAVGLLGVFGSYLAAYIGETFGLSTRLRKACYLGAIAGASIAWLNAVIWLMR